MRANDIKQTPTSEMQGIEIVMISVNSDLNKNTTMNTSFTSEALLPAHMVTATLTSLMPTKVSKLKTITLTSPATKAAVLFLDRKERLEHPEGVFDKAGRWEPLGRDHQVFDYANHRTPSRVYPNTWSQACRSAEHCAKFFEADVVEVRKIANKIKKTWDGKSTCQPIAEALVNSGATIRL